MAYKDGESISSDFGGKDGARQSPQIPAERKTVGDAFDREWGKIVEGAEGGIIGSPDPVLTEDELARKEANFLLIRGNIAPDEPSGP